MLSKLPIQWRWFLTAIFKFFRTQSSLLCSVVKVKWSTRLLFPELNSELNLKLHQGQGKECNQCNLLNPTFTTGHMQYECQLKGRMAGFLVVENNNVAWPHKEWVADTYSRLEQS